MGTSPRDRQDSRIGKAGGQKRSESPSFGSSTELKTGNKSQLSIKSPSVKDKESRHSEISPGKKKKLLSSTNDRMSVRNNNSAGSCNNGEHKGKRVNGYNGSDKRIKRNVCLDL